MKDYFSNEKKNRLAESEKFSMGSGLYSLNKAQKENSIAFPWAPGGNVDLSSTFLENSSVIDYESDLKGMTRLLSNDPLKKYVPKEGPLSSDSNMYKNINDGFFHPESSLLNEPAFDLKGMTKNRFISLKKNPQENVIEPFSREGENTYLDLIDTYIPCSVTPKH
jgi:hypothetical protein|tara:strand:- start:171 stop:665 length:495 start_codon:yes stop_codon:yes gene_type:complete